MSRWQYATLAVLIPVVIVAALVGGRLLRDDPEAGGIGIANAVGVTEFEHDYTIPAGTSDRIDAGETVEIVPLLLEVRVGESIRIVNDDDDGHVVGVFYVGAGETLTQQFTAPGELSGTCTVHSGGEFTVRVEA